MGCSRWFVSSLPGCCRCCMAQPAAAQTTPDAQAFPNRPVQLVVPFPPGGPTDLMARLFGQKLSERWGQPVVVENRAGGNSAIGAQQVAKSAPDGYTLLVAMDTTLVMNPITTSESALRRAQGFRADLADRAEHLAPDRARDDGPKTVQELIARPRPIPASSTTAPASSRRGSPAICSAGSPASTPCSSPTRAAPRSCRGF